MTGQSLTLVFSNIKHEFSEQKFSLWKICRYIRERPSPAYSSCASLQETQVTDLYPTSGGTETYFWTNPVEEASPHASSLEDRQINTLYRFFVTLFLNTPILSCSCVNVESL